MKVEWTAYIVVESFVRLWGKYVTEIEVRSGFFPFDADPKSVFDEMKSGSKNVETFDSYDFESWKDEFGVYPKNEMVYRECELMFQVEIGGEK